jgi:hypothetical protein
MSNIDSIVVQRGASTVSCADLQADALNDTTLNSTRVYTDATAAVLTYTDVSPAAGSYRYGVFAKNSAGVNVCDAGTGSSSDTVTVTWFHRSVRCYPLVMTDIIIFDKLADIKRLTVDESFLHLETRFAKERGRYLAKMLDPSTSSEETVALKAVVNALESLSPMAIANTILKIEAKNSKVKHPEMWKIKKKAWVLKP